MSVSLNRFICTPKILPPVIPVIGINFFDIPNKYCTIQLLYNKINVDNEEKNYRISNEAELQEKRWEWVQTNPEEYINLLRKAGLSDESISAMSTRKFPLGFKDEEQYERYRSDLFKTLQQISNNSGIIGFRVIQQGSYITGYSSNPRKGDRTLPNHIFGKNSDLDLRITARNLDEYFKTNNIKYETKKTFP